MPRQGKTCLFVRCLSRSKKNPEKKFYPFIKPWLNREKCLRWIAATGRKDLIPQHINKECYVCGDHFANDGPSEENPDPFPYLEDIDDPLELGENCVNLNSEQTLAKPALIKRVSLPEADLTESVVKHPRLGGGLSPARQPALILKKKALSPKKKLKLNQGSSRLTVTDGNKDTTQTSTSKFFSPLPVPHTDDVCALNRRLFDEFMTDIEANANVNEGIPPLLDFLDQDNPGDNVEWSRTFEKDGNRSVKTQTATRWTLDRSTANDKFKKSKTSNTEMEIMWTNIDSEDGGDGDDGDEKAVERDRNTAREGRKKRTAYISFESISTLDDDFEYLSGMSKRNFDLLYRYLGGDEVCSRLKYEAETGSTKIIRVTRLSWKCRLFMTLCRLRRGFAERELAILFGCSVSLVSRILNTWINFMFLELKPLEEHMFRDRGSIKLTTPQRFKSFKGLRVIIDCTEIKIATPSNFQQQGNTWSSYKHSNTVKYLVGINVRGAVCYVSEAFEASMSDKEVFIRSSMYDMLQAGDVVMADRKFDVWDDLDRIKVKFVIPSYIKGGGYLPPEDEVHSQKVARSRIFVENAIGRIKMWRILNSTFPQSTLPLVSQMMFLCVCLTNFQPQLL